MHKKILILLLFFAATLFYIPSINAKAIDIINDDVEENLINEYTEIINDIPESIIKMYEDEEWTIEFFSDFTKDEYAQSLGFQIAGYCDYYNKRIRINTQVSKNYIEVVINHEMGHFVDYMITYFDFTGISYSLQFLSNSEKFTEIYRQYKNKYVIHYYKDYKDYENMKIYINYMTSNQHEFFASLYGDYIAYPEYVKNTCPEGYEFMCQINNMFNNIIFKKENYSKNNHNYFLSNFNLQIYKKFLINNKQSNNYYEIKNDKNVINFENIQSVYDTYKNNYISYDTNELSDFIDLTINYSYSDFIEVIKNDFTNHSNYLKKNYKNLYDLLSGGNL